MTVYQFGCCSVVCKDVLVHLHFRMGSKVQMLVFSVSLPANSVYRVSLKVAAAVTRSRHISRSR